MSETRDTSPVSFGEFAVLADNYQWSGLDAESASRFEDLIARNQFPLYPDTMFIIMCRSGSFTITSGGETVEARPRDAIVTLGGQPVEGVEISPDCRLVFFSGKSPGAIIEEYTIAEAKQLLVSKKYSVSSFPPRNFFRWSPKTRKTVLSPAMPESSPRSSPCTSNISSRKTTTSFPPGTGLS